MQTRWRLTGSVTHWLTGSLAYWLSYSLALLLTRSLALLLTGSLAHWLTRSLDPQVEAPIQKKPSTWEQTRGFKADKYPQLVVFLGCKAIITLAYLLLEFSFALYTSERFGLEPKANG